MHKTFAQFLALLFSIISLAANAQAPNAIIDVKHYNFAIQLSDADNNIKGRADITVKFLKTATSFSVNLVKKNAKGKGMTVSQVSQAGRSIKFAQDSDAVTLYANATANQQKTYTIVYEGIPADGLIISTNKFGNRTFFGDNWPNRGHNWLPCVDEPADKASVDFLVTAPNHYQVIANGLKQSETPLPNKLKLTHWAETAQLPTKVMVIGVAEFAITQSGNVNGIPVSTYVFPETKEVGFKSYAVAAEILPFYISKVGPYAYKKLANVESKTIFGGMENASCIFYFEGSVKSKGIEELMAHEIAHQWFGDAASEKDFHHLWLSEGFATYLTNYYLESKYGPDTLKRRLAADRALVLKFEKRHFAPVVDTAVKNNYMPLLNANSYQKGSWALHMLRRKLGDVVFWKGVSAYYAKYNGGNANTADLEHIMEQTSGQDLTVFFKQWLNTAGHPDLNITWKYDAAEHGVTLKVDQTQPVLYHFPLEITIDGGLHTIDVTDQSMTATFPVGQTKPVVTVDPNVNLLASFTVGGN